MTVLPVFQDQTNDTMALGLHFSTVTAISILERPVLKDHIFSWEKVPHFNAVEPVTKDHMP